jgi:hypothetical protein
MVTISDPSCELYASLAPGLPTGDPPTEFEEVFNASKTEEQIKG